MEYKHLGKSGLKVSPLCLGTMNFGPQTTEPDSYAIMDRAIAEGINFFDTADVYGGKKGEGVTEQIVGRWFSTGGLRRERTILATKVYGGMQPDDKPNINRGFGLSARKIVKQCEASLHRLQTDYIDLYQMHHVDRECPVEEICQAYDTLVAQGKVIYAGSSNFAGWDIATYNMTARAQHGLGLVSEQSVYHLDNRMVELEVVPACRHYGLGIIPWSPLAGGLLGGALQKASEGRRGNADFQRRSSRSGRSWRSTRPCARSSNSPPPPSPWRGCCTTRS